MEQRKPRSRKKVVSNDSKGIQRSGEGLSKMAEAIENTAREQKKESDSEEGHSTPTRAYRPSGGAGYPAGGRGPGRSGGGCRRYIFLLVFLVCAYFVVSYFLNSLSQMQGGGNTPAQTAAANYTETIAQGNGVQTGWTLPETQEVDPAETEVTARDKFTQIKGNGEDTVTIMVYMCGTDLESQSGMATSDLQEMLNADVGDKVNLIIFTGGCTRWRNSVVSSQYNQIYQIQNGQLMRLVENAGTSPMTDPDNLQSFIEFCAANFKADRYELILWDHGTGSVHGYAYDEKYPRSGQMTLEQIDRALTASGVKFDFVGFDACLMATAETALMLGDNADYLIASEEVEPGIGWYYTDWLTAFSADTSMPTVEVGRNIGDTFYATCRQKTPGQAVTLSVVDLAELSQTMPPKFKAFSESTSGLIDSGEFRKVSTARSTTKEFARGQNIDQIDLVHFASLMKTKEGDELVETVRSAVKYNITSKDVANAYGLSIYFPYNSVRQVDVAKVIYEAIGMDQSYSDLLTRFARYQVSGQSTSGGYSSPMQSLFGSNGQGVPSVPSGQYQEYGSMDYEEMLDLLNLLMGGRMGDVSSLGIDGLTEENSKFLTDGDTDVEAIARAVSENRITQEDVTWKQDGGTSYIELTDEKWGMISRIDMAAFLDDGKGYIDLGLDNLFTFEGNRMIPENDGTWIAINGQPMAYYHTETLDVSDDQYSIKGRVPVLLNGKRADLIIVFDQDNEDGYVAGSTFDYAEDETSAIPKNLGALEKGDTIDFVAKCYNYDGTVDDEYVISSEQMVIDDPENIAITNVDVTQSGKLNVMYCLTDIYGQKYWTNVL